MAASPPTRPTAANERITQESVDDAFTEETKKLQFLEKWLAYEDTLHDFKSNRCGNYNIQDFITLRPDDYTQTKIDSLMIGSSDREGVVMKIFKYLFKDSDPKYDLESYEHMALDESMDSSAIGDLNNMFCLKVDKRMTDYTALLKDFIKTKYGIVTLHTDCMKPALYKPDYVHDIQNIKLDAHNVIQPDATKSYLKLLSIASEWDQASKDASIGAYAGQVKTSIEIPNVDNITFNNNSVQFKLGNTTYEFSIKFLEENKMLTSVQELCNLGTIRDRQKSADGRPAKIAKLGELKRNISPAMFSDDLISLADDNNFLKSITSLKRSMDYGQIEMVKSFVQHNSKLYIYPNANAVTVQADGSGASTSTAHVPLEVMNKNLNHFLVTFDRLCFIRSLMRETPVLFQKGWDGNYQFYFYSNYKAQDHLASFISVLQTVYNIVQEVKKLVKTKGIVEIKPVNFEFILTDEPASEDDKEQLENLNDIYSKLNTDIFTFVDHYQKTSVYPVEPYLSEEDRLSLKSFHKNAAIAVYCAYNLLPLCLIEDLSKIHSKIEEYIASQLDEQLQRVYDASDRDDSVAKSVYTSDDESDSMRTAQSSPSAKSGMPGGLPIQPEPSESGVIVQSVPTIGNRVAHHPEDGEVDQPLREDEHHEDEAGAQEMEDSESVLTDEEMEEEERRIIEQHEDEDPIPEDIEETDSDEESDVEIITDDEVDEEPGLEEVAQVGDDEAYLGPQQGQINGVPIVEQAPIAPIVEQDSHGSQGSVQVTVKTADSDRPFLYGHEEGEVDQPHARPQNSQGSVQSATIVTADSHGNFLRQLPQQALRIPGPAIAAQSNSAPQVSQDQPMQDAISSIRKRPPSAQSLQGQHPGDRTSSVDSKRIRSQGPQGAPSESQSKTELSSVGSEGNSQQPTQPPDLKDPSKILEQLFSWCNKLKNHWNSYTKLTKMDIPNTIDNVYSGMNSQRFIEATNINIESLLLDETEATPDVLDAYCLGPLLGTFNGHESRRSQSYDVKFFMDRLNKYLEPGKPKIEDEKQFHYKTIKYDAVRKYYKICREYNDEAKQKLLEQLKAQLVAEEAKQDASYKPVTRSAAKSTTAESEQGITTRLKNQIQELEKELDKTELTRLTNLLKKKEAELQAAEDDQMRFTRLNPKETVINRINGEIHMIKEKLANYDPNRLPIPKLNKQQIESKAKYLAATIVLKLQLRLYLAVLTKLHTTVKRLVQMIREEPTTTTQSIHEQIQTAQKTVDEESNIYDMIKEHIKKRPKNFKSISKHLSKLYDRETFWNRFGDELKAVTTSSDMLIKANTFLEQKIHEVEELYKTLERQHFFSVEEALNLLTKENMEKLITDLQNKSYIDYLINIRKSIQSFYMNVSDGLSKTDPQRPHNNEFAQLYKEALAKIDDFINSQNEPSTSGSQAGGALDDDGFDDDNDDWDDEDFYDAEPTQYVLNDTTQDMSQLYEAKESYMKTIIADYLSKSIAKDVFSDKLVKSLVSLDEEPQLSEEQQLHYFEVMHNIELRDITLKQSEKILNLTLKKYFQEMPSSTKIDQEIQGIVDWLSQQDQQLWYKKYILYQLKNLTGIEIPELMKREPQQKPNELAFLIKNSKKLKARKVIKYEEDSTMTDVITQEQSGENQPKGVVMKNASIVEPEPPKSTGPPHPAHSDRSDQSLVPKKQSSQTSQPVAPASSTGNSGQSPSIGGKSSIKEHSFFRDSMKATKRSKIVNLYKQKETRRQYYKPLDIVAILLARYKAKQMLRRHKK